MTKNADLKNFRRLAGFKIYCLILFLAICLTAGASSFAASIGDLKQDISGGEAVSTQQTSSSSALDDSAKAAAEDKYEMALLADLHICESNLKAVTQAINAANGFGVNATAILGDSCKEIATEKEFDIAVKTIRKLKSKVFAVTGNHDCIYEDHKTAEGKKIRAGAAVKKHKLERFNEAFGQKSNYFAHKANGYLLVFLSADALDAKHLVTLSAHSLKWLENTLSKNKNMPTIIFCHAPLENTFKASEKLGMANSSVQPADKVEDILKSNKQVFMWASGHAHIRTSNKHFASSANIWKNQVHAVHNGNINNDARCFNMLTLTSKYVLVRTYDAKNDKWLKKFDRKIGHDGKLIADDGKIEDEEKDEPQKDGDDEDEDKNEDGPDGAANNDNKDGDKKEPEDLKGIVTPGLGEVKVRDGAWGNVIGTLFSGKFVDIKSVEGDWYIIDYNGKKGYILKQAMLTNSGDDSKLKKMKTTATVDVDPAYGLNVRDGAWGDKIGKLDDGDKIEITGVEGDWYKIKFKGKTGFVYKAYVDVNKAGEKRIAGAEEKPASPVKQSGADNKTVEAADGKKADNSSQPAAGTKGFEKSGLLNVPERAQRAPENGPLGHSLCGPTSLAMALDFYGVNKPTVKVAKETKTLSSGGGWQGTYCGNILAAAKSNGFNGSYMKENMTIDSLKSITASGKPVIANVDTQGYWGSGHYMVVTGVKDGLVYVNDPWKGGQRTYSFASFKAQWATRNERAIVVQP
ncbi:MAG: Bacterial SH3 domain protein [bacterium ADurb.Bin243]|mgnify:CR=1 FL=1|nr:MAG: Bacterial SH3 domain protein [bacterium ADurb.Bin243]HOD39794.1 C39 family peptidase [Candidatus Wallbacteria bacterium]